MDLRQLCQDSPFLRATFISSVSVSKLALSSDCVSSLIKSMLTPSYPGALSLSNCAIVSRSSSVEMSSINPFHVSAAIPFAFLSYIASHQIGFWCCNSGGAGGAPAVCAQNFPPLQQGSLRRRPGASSASHCLIFSPVKGGEIVIFWNLWSTLK